MFFEIRFFNCGDGQIIFVKIVLMPSQSAVGDTFHTFMKNIYIVRINSVCITRKTKKEETSHLLWLYFQIISVSFLSGTSVLPSGYPKINGAIAL